MLVENKMAQLPKAIKKKCMARKILRKKKNTMWDSNSLLTDGSQNLFPRNLLRIFSEFSSFPRVSKMVGTC